MLFISSVLVFCIALNFSLAFGCFRCFRYKFTNTRLYKKSSQYIDLHRLSINLVEEYHHSPDNSNFTSSIIEEGSYVKIVVPDLRFENVKLKEFMISSIMWYKSFLSPIMPKNCRFIPSCSTYGIEAIQQFGAWKGLMLIVWRIFRCNPTGGSGYDPPIYPPVNYFAGSTSKKRKPFNKK